MNKYRWIEIWVDDYTMDYFLAVKCREDEVIELFDIPKGKVKIQDFNTYEELVRWMLDEEYVIVDGRVIPES